MMTSTIFICQVYIALLRMYPGHQDVPQVQTQIAKTLDEVKVQCAAGEAKAEKAKDEKKGK